MPSRRSRWQLDHYAKFGEKALGGLAVVTTAAETYHSIRKDGAVRGLEENAGDWASLAAGGAVGIGLGIAGGALIAAGAPEILVGVGVVAVGAVVCAGVGDVTQSYVNRHQKGATRVLDDIGHGTEKAAIWGADHTGLTPESAS